MVLRRPLTDGERDILREQEQDARAVEQSVPDPDAMAEAFGPITERYSDEQLAEMARAYFLEYGWPGQEGTP